MNELRDVLADIGTRTPPYDVVDSALTAARRRRGRRRLAGTGLALVAVTGAAAGAYAVGGQPQPNAKIGASAPAVPSPTPASSAEPGPLRCTAKLLPIPAGMPPKSFVTGGDPSGRTLLGRLYPHSGPVAVVWHTTSATAPVTAVTVDLPGSDDQLTDANSAGVAVGTSFLGDKPAAWTYRDGQAHRLPGGAAEAAAVNERGDIAGTVAERPAVWRAGHTAPQPLAVPRNTLSGGASGIDDDGTVVGSVTLTGSTAASPENLTHAYAWGPDGSARELPMPSTPDGQATEAYASSIRAGWVTGDVHVPRGRGGFAVYTARWNLRTGEVDVSDQVGPGAIVNAQGWLAGPGKDGLVLVTTQAVVPLPVLGGTPGRYDDVSALSDDGRTVAGQRNPDTDLNGARAQVWHCG